MMKKSMKMIAVAFAMVMFLTSCYSYTSVVGEGAQANVKKTEWNHYLIYGLAPVKVSDSQKMADGAKNYTIKTKHTFINGLVGGLTFGIYTPTTTIVTK